MNQLFNSDFFVRTLFSYFPKDDLETYMDFPHINRKCREISCSNPLYEIAKYCHRYGHRELKKWKSREETNKSEYTITDFIDNNDNEPSYRLYVYHIAVDMRQAIDEISILELNNHKFILVGRCYDDTAHYWSGDIRIFYIDDNDYIPIGYIYGGYEGPPQTTDDITYIKPANKIMKELGLSIDDINVKYHQIYNKFIRAILALFRHSRLLY